MVQINETSTIQDDGGGQRAFRMFLRFLWTFLFLFIAWMAMEERNVVAATMLTVSGVIYFLFLNNIVWSISNTIRKWIMPEAFITANAMGAIKQKIFWSIGPQWFGSMIIFVLIYGVVTIWTGGSFGELKPKPSFSRDSTILENKSSSNNQNQNFSSPQVSTPPSDINQDNSNSAKLSTGRADNSEERVLTKQQIDELEQKAKYSGDDPVIRQRLGLPPKIKD